MDPKVEQAEARLRAACEKFGANEYHCALWCWHSDQHADDQISLNGVAASSGLCTNAQAWAIMSGWDDIARGSQFLPRYKQNFDQAREAEWYALGQRLARDFMH